MNKKETDWSDYKDYFNLQSLSPQASGQLKAMPVVLVCLFVCGVLDAGCCWKNGMSDSEWDERVAEATAEREAREKTEKEAKSRALEDPDLCQKVEDCCEAITAITPNDEKVPFCDMSIFKGKNKDCWFAFELLRMEHKLESAQLPDCTAVLE